MSTVRLLLIEAGHHLESQSQKPVLDDAQFPTGFVPVRVDSNISSRAVLDIAADAAIVIHCGDQRSALSIVRKLKKVCASIPILLVASATSEEFIIDAFHAGVTRYLKSPFAIREFQEALDRIAELVSDVAPAANGEHELRGTTCLIGNSVAMCDLRRCIRQVAVSNANVLITGETGTGKELVAQLIHENSPRHNGPFICLNTVAIPEPLFESELFGYERGAFTGALSTQQGKLAAANRGTVFLDEIGDVSKLVQAKLLRAIESKRIEPLGATRSRNLDVRVLAATNQDLETATRENRFRSDLYYRLNVVRIEIPPLRDHSEDLAPLIEYYCGHFSHVFGKRVMGFNAGAMDILCAYSWPGNIRELRNILESTFVNLSDRIYGFIDLPNLVIRQLQCSAPPGSGERTMLVRALNATNWNRTAAAKRLQWSRMTLYRKMVRYHVVDSWKTKRVAEDAESEN